MISIMNNGNSIQTISSFSPSGSFPIDDRMVVDTIEDRDNISNTYIGLITYVKSDNTYYQYTEKGWIVGIPKIHYVSGIPNKSLGGINDWAISDSGNLYYKELKGNTVSWTSKAIMGGSGDKTSGSITIAHSYTSIEQMENSINIVNDGELAIISSNDENNGSLYKKITLNNNPMWRMLASLSGPKGDKGEDGKSSTIEINSVNTGDPNSEVIIENVGTDTNLSLNITIPRGQRGYNGDKGDKGDPGEPSIVNGKEAVNGFINITLDDIPDGDERILNNIVVEDF